MYPLHATENQLLRFDRIGLWEASQDLSHRLSRCNGWGKGFINSYNVKVKVKVKLSLCLTKHQAMKAYWGVEVYFTRPRH